MCIKDDKLFSKPTIVEVSLELAGCEAGLEGIVIYNPEYNLKHYYYAIYTPQMGEVLGWEEYTVKKDERYTQKGDQWLFCHFVLEPGEKTKAYQQLQAEKSRWNATTWPTAPCRPSAASRKRQAPTTIDTRAS